MSPATPAAPALDAVTEHVGDFADESLAPSATQGAAAVVTTVHPMRTPSGGTT
jgi:hypothetical protein